MTLAVFAGVATGYANVRRAPRVPAAVSADPASVAWRRSRSLGVPWGGRLVNGVRLPLAGERYFTWDPVRRRSPNRPARLWGNDRVVRIVLRVVRDYDRQFPDAPRLGIGDLSRRYGGAFGPKHVSHQNGLDVDVYYPRLDRRERPPRRVDQIDRRLAQWLVDRFVQAGASQVFVGPNLDLTGPRRVVEKLWNHDNHLHARFPRTFRVTRVIGRSTRSRAIRATTLGDAGAPRRLLAIGCIHGDECAGTAVTRMLVRRAPLRSSSITVVHHLNPDGFIRRSRGNARGVDLNRDFGAFSQPETRAVRRLVRRLRPTVTVWFHQPHGHVRGWGPSAAAARRYARLSGLPFRGLPWIEGGAPAWQNRGFAGTASYVVELPPGRLAPADAERHARALVAIARSR
ncbi:MAG: penicillin-insensitive murein endopeptidase [Thermoleophilia bacterium]|nr:penicillin-insensitive murein endopeptidase [Thermoleophilia bacterium]